MIRDLNLMSVGVASEGEFNAASNMELSPTKVYSDMLSTSSSRMCLPRELMIESCYVVVMFESSMMVTVTDWAAKAKTGASTLARLSVCMFADVRCVTASYRTTCVFVDWTLSGLLAAHGRDQRRAESCRPSRSPDEVIVGAQFKHT